MAARQAGCARTRPPVQRKHIPYIESAGARVYRTGLRRCVAQNRIVEAKINPVKSVQRDSEFIAKFRFPRPLVQRIAAEFGASPFWEKTNDPALEDCANFCNAEWVTCIGMRYLATGAQLSVLADTQGRAVKGCLSKNINSFIEFLAAKSASNVHFPETAEELMDLEMKFSEKYGLSGCIGCADGTLVPMKTPIMNEAAFFCRKYYHALNVMIICDADMRIIAIDAGFGGAHADSTVFDMSIIGRRIIREGLLHDYYILGDNGYALTEHIITPFRRKELEGELRTQPRLDFQKVVTGARAIIEQCNAQLKGRWRVLSKQGSGVIQRDPQMVSLIVHACAYLHNLAIDEGLMPFTRETQRDPELEPLIAANSVKYLLNAVKRNRHRHFKAHNRPQNKAEYLKGVMKRNQILREQFGDRSVRIGHVKRRAGRPRAGNRV